MPQIYISYRLQDANAVDAIVRRCLQTYGIYSILMNPEESCPSETTLTKHIDNLMFGAHTILLVVGKDWAGIDKFGRFKLSSADIPVGAEARVALRSEKQVILVLVNGAHMPVPDIVPDDLHEIFSLPVIQIRPQSFYQDLNTLVPPPSLSNMLFYYFSLAWTKRYIRSEYADEY